MHWNRRIIGVDDLRERYFEVYEDVRAMDVLYSRHAPEEDRFGLMLIHPDDTVEMDGCFDLTSERR